MGTNIKKELLRFVSEDIQSGDVTSVLLPKKKIKAKIISRQEGILAGIRFARDIFYLKGCRVRIIKKDGTKIKPNQTKIAKTLKISVEQWKKEHPKYALKVT